MIDLKKDLVVVRGAGDLATGTIIYLKRAGFRVIALETANPTTIRRTVALSDCVYDGKTTVEGVLGVKVDTVDEALKISIEKSTVPVLVDENGSSISKFKPRVLVDAIIAKRNCGTKITDAPLVIALGPGFTVGVDCTAVIETARGHYLARVITEKERSAIPNTGIPGIIAGVGKERVIHSPCGGTFKGIKEIGDSVKQGEIIAYVDETPVFASISGTIRGLLHSGLTIKEHFKIADIDPRDCKEYIYFVSDKARAIAGGVILAIMMLS